MANTHLASRRRSVALPPAPPPSPPPDLLPPAPLLPLTPLAAAPLVPAPPPAALARGFFSSGASAWGAAQAREAGCLRVRGPQRQGASVLGCMDTMRCTPHLPPPLQTRSTGAPPPAGRRLRGARRAACRGPTAPHAAGPPGAWRRGGLPPLGGRGTRGRRRRRRCRRGQSWSAGTAGRRAGGARCQGGNGLRSATDDTMRVHAPSRRRRSWRRARRAPLHDCDHE